ncbi:MAG: hypothetical protein ACTSXH_17895 [Promethearchaeota archaeon]
MKENVDDGIELEIREHSDADFSRNIVPTASHPISRDSLIE